MKALGPSPPSEADPYVHERKWGSTWEIMLCITIWSKIMPEGSIVLYFQMRIFLVFHNVNMKGFKF